MSDLKEYDVAAIRNWCGVTHYHGCDCHEKRRNDLISDLQQKVHLLNSKQGQEVAPYRFFRDENNTLFVAHENGECMGCNPETEAKLIAKLDEFWKENF